MDRRTYLGLVGAIAGLSGCLSDTFGGDTDSGSGTVPPTDAAATSATRTTTDAAATASATPTGTPIHPEYETTEVRIQTPDGERLGSVTAAIADTGALRYRGLSDTEFLPEDRGMLFVYENVGDHTYVMRGMDFGIDIVYADADGTITRIHHAPEPGPDENGEAQRYPGRGQYVLEVGYRWTTERGITEGGRLVFTLPE
ncbi:MAG: DUF192 domain-containing protein [Halobellus sp.]|uniref:DUF192 domain-containing protein n=1 Tax=Halobellus sp. TaxID=1979212 RepID=UPI0035D44DC4